MTLIIIVSEGSDYANVSALGYIGNITTGHPLTEFCSAISAVWVKCKQFGHGL